MHQEDFCQALGIIPEMKYQREGGPSLSDCFALIRKVSSIPAVDIKQLLQGVLFNLIIGNNDAHAKNFSLLYQHQTIHLAPFYDMIATVCYPELAKKMAMKIGNKYDFDRLFPRHIQQMAEQANLSVSLVNQEVLKLINKLEKNIPDSPFSKAILQRAELLRKRYLSN